MKDTVHSRFSFRRLPGFIGFTRGRFFCALCLVMMFSCKQRQPEFFIDGKPFYTEKVCIKSHTQTVLIPHHVGKVLVVRPQVQTVCDTYRIDTLEYKAK